MGFMNRAWVSNPEDSKPEDPEIEKLEKEFAKLSLKAERQGSFKVENKPKQSRRKGPRVPPGTDNPFLKRNATAKELTEGIDKLQDLCRDTMDELEPYIEAEEKMEREEFVRFLNHVLHHL
ncbi:hypothetical protein PG996_011246 [Apiospora saccharicola]|uniref:Uncharacterized protein n=1 Tax=Apiospora saccharicola TaxID=335842 RepID=A0ABR1UEJ5_9PEZI